MTATATSSTVIQAARLVRRLEQHKADVQRLRDEIPNPGEALSAFVRDRFELHALVPPDRSGHGLSTSAWEGDDEFDAW